MGLNFYRDNHYAVDESDIIKTFENKEKIRENR